MSSTVPDVTLSRRHKRIPFEKEALLLQGADLQSNAQEDTGLSGWTENISDVGACLVSKAKVKANQILKVALKVGMGHIPTLVEVKWVRKGGRSNSRFGVKYTF